MRIQVFELELGKILVTICVENEMHLSPTPFVVHANDKEQLEQQKKLRKGDLVKYKGHISMVYSEKPDDKGNYKIIHAYGRGGFIDHDGDKQTDKVFVRKAVVTRHNVKTSQGYGRIRLWD